MATFSRTFDERRTIERLTKLYGLGPKVLRCSKIINGHINDTYNVTVLGADGKSHSYIYQRVNSSVFSEPALIMQNLAVIREWLESHQSDSACHVLTFLKTRIGTNFVTSPSGGFWRVSEFVEHSIVFDMIEDERVMEKTGQAFGEFQLQLAGIPMDNIVETIPDFHNTPKRIQTLLDAAAADTEGRAAECEKDIIFFEDNREHFSTLQRLRDDGIIPVRITHNDTKCNNILFDRDTFDPVMIIDLDTIMPGLAAYDYGDAIRCAANFAPEDEPDLHKVGLNLKYFEAFTRGFVGACKEVMTDEEEKNLALGAPTLAFELGARFLTDYLSGDTYFKPEHPHHNLERARCQIRLCQDMMKRYDLMCRTVDKYYC